MWRDAKEGSIGGGSSGSGKTYGISFRCLVLGEGAKQTYDVDVAMDFQCRAIGVARGRRAATCSARRSEEAGEGGRRVGRWKAGSTEAV